jgi:adenylylsulfate kinase-like enzyme
MWICGAAGAGKSVAAWELFAEFAAADTRVAYVDIDQLGMLYPEADDDVGWCRASDFLAGLLGQS